MATHRPDSTPVMSKEEARHIMTTRARSWARASERREGSLDTHLVRGLLFRRLASGERVAGRGDWMTAGNGRR